MLSIINDSDSNKSDALFIATTGADNNSNYNNNNMLPSIDWSPLGNLSQDKIDLLKFLNDKYSHYGNTSGNGRGLGSTLDDNYTVIIIYGIIVLISLFGNLLVCFVIMKNKTMRTKTNILMANITISGLMITVFNIPFNIARILLNDWPFGVVLCKLLPAIQVTSVYVSTFTMTIIAIDRYQAINTRFYRRISNVLPISITIKIIWIFAAIFSTPELIFNKLVDFKLIGQTRCNTVYPSPSAIISQLITVLTFSTQYLIPLAITTGAYVKIINKICRKYRHRTNDIQKRIKRTDQKIIKMLAFVVIVFAICWLPLNLFHIYSDFSKDIIRYDSILFYSCHMLAMSSVCYNPFIYFGLNKHFRREIGQLFRCLPGVGRRHHTIGDTSDRRRTGRSLISSNSANNYQENNNSSHFNRSFELKNIMVDYLIMIIGLYILELDI
ncbi:G-protein coupled receptor 83-like [Oppia nitens]|uniref:G-protein coupled receptor 83-like n=1 Tax=Oppia nitens TaxID=1686743 RepID=UPI0023D9FF1A|nr:G-protein coupled receptor 83-like [Oppia nitens]